MPTTTESFRPRSIVEKRFDAIARGCLLLSVVATMGGMFGFLLVWGGMVAPGWVVSAIFLSAALVIAVIRASVRRRLVGRGGEPAPEAFGLVGRACRGDCCLYGFSWIGRYSL